METNPVVQLFLALGIIIFSARLAGTLSRRLGQPRVFGELLAGVILGPTLLNLPNWPVFTDEHLGETIHELAEIGVLLLMFSVGLDVHLSELLQVGRVALFGGFLGALAPVLLAIPVVAVFGFSFNAGLFVGVALAATSVSISAQTLLELGLLQTREGYALLATALVDDVIAILLVSFAVAATMPTGSASFGDMVMIIVRMAVFIAAAGAAAWYGLPLLLNWLAQHQESGTAYGRSALALVSAFLFGWAAEALGGIAAITGAFIAGLGISRTEDSTKNWIRESMLAIIYVFVLPVFFADVGLRIDLKQIGLSALPFAVLLLVVAVISKVGGALIGGRLGGFDRQTSFRLGICMISRGEVGLIIAAIGLKRGIFDQTLFPSLFLVILASTVITPPLVRWAFRGPKPAAQTAST